MQRPAARGLARLGLDALPTGPVLVERLAVGAPEHGDGEVVADAVGVADADHRQHGRATPEHVDVLAERVDEGAQAAAQRFRSGHPCVVATALLRAEVEEVELHHVDAPAPHLRPEVAQVVDDGGVRGVESPASVAIAQPRPGRRVEHAPVLVLGPEARRARLHHERGQPQPAPVIEAMDLLDQLTEVVGEPLARPPRTVRLLPAVVDLEQVEHRSMSEPLAQQPRVLEQTPGADPGRVVVPRLPAEGRRSRPRATPRQRRDGLGHRERVRPGADRDPLRRDLVSWRHGSARRRDLHLVAPAAVDEVMRRRRLGVDGQLVAPPVDARDEPLAGEGLDRECSRRGRDRRAPVRVRRARSRAHAGVGPRVVAVHQLPIRLRGHDAGEGDDAAHVVVTRGSVSRLHLEDVAVRREPELEPRGAVGVGPARSGAGAGRLDVPDARARLRVPGIGFDAHRTRPESHRALRPARGPGSRSELEPDRAVAQGSAHGAPFTGRGSGRVGTTRPRPGSAGARSWPRRPSGARASGSTRARA